MPSLAEKMSMLVDEYNHSKNSPSYRKLNTKYKALKATNSELVHLLTNIFSELNANRKSNEEPKFKTKPSRNKLRRPYNNAKHESCNYQHNGPDTLNQNDDWNNIENVYQQNTLNEKEEHVNEPIVEDTSTLEECVNEIVKQTIEDEKMIVNTVEKQEDVVEETVEEQVEETVEEQVEETVEEEVEETVEEEVEETVEEQVEETVEEEVEETVEEEEQDETGVYEIEVEGIRYYTTSEKDGIVYELLDDDDVGDEIGKFINGKLVLNNK